MRDVKYDNDRYGGVDYGDLIETMDLHETVVEASDDDYQGDTYMVVRQGQRYGFLTFGWGSCSGCDAAQAVSSQQEANDLRDQIWNSIRWFADARELVLWMQTFDHETQFYSYRGTFKRFHTEVEEKLRERFAPTDEELTAARQSIQTSIRSGS